MFIAGLALEKMKIKIFFWIFLVFFVSFVFSAPLVFQSKLMENMTDSKKVDRNTTLLCSACTLMADTIRKLMEMNATEDAVADALVGICKTFKIEDDYICINIVKEFKVRQ